MNRICLPRIGIAPRGIIARVILLCVIGLSHIARADERIIQDVDQHIQDSINVVNLHFYKPLMLVRLYPGNLCQQCSFIFRPLSSSPAELADYAHEEVIKIPSLSGSLVKDARYQGDSQGNITITIDFSRIVSITTEQDAGKRKLGLSINSYERPEDKQTVNVSTDNATAAIPDRIFVINLESSTRELTISRLDNIPELADYKNYMTRVEFNNQRWYRHRLGFASTEEDAALLLGKVKKYFPQAWIDTASPAERTVAQKFYSLKPHLLVWPKEKIETKPKEATAKAESQQKDLFAILSVKPSATQPHTPPAPATTTSSSAAPGKVTSIEPSKPASVSTPPVPPEVKNIADDKTRNLMERARQAMIDLDYPTAIAIYTKLLASEDLQERKDAMEYLGVARERNNQASQARLIYNEYLQKYPEGIDADRVQQRLVGLATATAEPKKELIQTEAKKPETHWEFINVLSQFYRKQDSKFDQNSTTTTDNSISSDFSSNGRYRGERYDMRTQFNINNRYSFLDQNTSSSSTPDTRVNTAYFDVSDKVTGMSGRFGRQTQNSYGVLGRFDGAFMSYRFDPQYKVNLVYGYPVDFTKTTGVYGDKNISGLSMDMGTFAQHWDMNVYLIQQTVTNIDDRQAVGSEVKYLSQDFTAFTLVDYDTLFGSLNTALFVGSWRFADNSSFNLNLDYRNSPYLTMSNALIGVTTVTTLSQLLQLYPEDYVKQLALDRTARSKSMTLSYNKPLSQDYQVTADITATKLGSTPATVDPPVPATTGTDTDVFYSVQLIANNFIFNSDVTIFGLRYADATTSKTTSLSFSNRTSLNDDWKINPRLYIDKQEINDGTKRLLIKPFLKFDYRATKNVKFEMELGYEHVDSTGGINGDTTESNQYIFIGYIWDF